MKPKARNTHKPLFRSPSIIACLLAFIAALGTIWLGACGSTPVKAGGQIEFSATRVSEAPRPLITPTPLPPPSQSSVPIPPSDGFFDRGLLLTNRDPQILQQFIDQAPDYAIRHVELGGSILKAVDDLILNPQGFAQVQQLTIHAANLGLKTYVWSREIHLEGQSFPFQWDAPLVIARQAAYRTAFQRLPQLDGVILELDESLLPPWKAQVSSPQVNFTERQKVQFVVEMVRKVVVEELGKRMIVSTRGETPEQKRWIVEAVAALGDPSLTLLVPARDLAAARNAASGQAGVTFWAEVDLTGKSEGAERMFYTLPDALRNLAREEGKIQGGAAQVDFPEGSILNTVHELNLFVYGRVDSPDSPPLVALVEEWIQRRTGILPQSEEGRAVRDLLLEGPEYVKRLGNVRGAGFMSLEENPPYTVRYQSGAQPYSEYIIRDVINPSRQTVIDLAQESEETVEWARRAEARLREQWIALLNPEVYRDLHQRAVNLFWLAQVYTSLGQCDLAERIWKMNQNEEMALNLEYYLQRLEALAQAAGEVFQSGAPPVRPEALMGFAGGIRREFPRVLLGARPCAWNRIHGVALKQRGANEVEITWQSDAPSTSRIFVTQQAPVFDQMIPAAMALTREHRAIINGLKAGELYIFKVQCLTEKGDVTNSGNYPFRMEALPIS